MDKLKAMLSEHGTVTRDVRNVNGRFITLEAPLPRTSCYEARRKAQGRPEWPHVSNVSFDPSDGAWSFQAGTRKPAITGRGVFHQPGAFGDLTRIKFRVRRE